MMTNLMALRYVSIVFFILVVVGGVAGSYVIDTTGGYGRRFEGIGGLSGGGATSRFLPNYLEPSRSQILDFLFKPGFGASLHILKVEIGGGGQSTEGTEHSHMYNETEENYERGYEWWLMQQAKERNLDIQLYGLAWAFPGWVADGRTALTTKTATYIVKWLLAAKTVYGLNIDYVGIWNERDPPERDYIITLRRQITAAGLATQIIAADEIGNGAICGDMAKDAELAAAIYAVGLHYPHVTLEPECSALNKPIFASEDFSNHYTAGRPWAEILNHNYVLGNITGTIAWNLVAAYYDNLPFGGRGLFSASSPWSGAYDVNSVLWATAHTTQFTAIGWHYLRNQSGVGRLDGGGSYVTLTNGTDFTIVVEGFGGKNQVVNFQLGGALTEIKYFHVFYSSFEANNETWFSYLGTLSPVKNQLTLQINGTEIYTLSTINGTKGDYGPPPIGTPFPLPYADNFDDAPLHSEAKYLTDQAGAFEVVQSGAGKVMRQMMVQRPISWCREGEAPYPYSVIGNYNWTAIVATVNVSFEYDRGIAIIATQVTSGGCAVAKIGSPGIVFALNNTQGSSKWILSNSTALTYHFDSGSTPSPIAPNSWHQLQLSVTKKDISASIDGTLVTHIPLFNSSNGWVAIGSSWDHVQFDDLIITSPSDMDEDH
jgi:galactosylceramidase